MDLSGEAAVGFCGVSDGHESLCSNGWFYFPKFQGRPGLSVATLSPAVKPRDDEEGLRNSRHSVDHRERSMVTSSPC